MFRSLLRRPTFTEVATKVSLSTLLQGAFTSTNREIVDGTASTSADFGRAMKHEVCVSSRTQE